MPHTHLRKRLEDGRRHAEKQAARLHDIEKRAEARGRAKAYAVAIYQLKLAEKRR